MNLFRPQASSSGVTAMKLSCGFWTLFIGKLGEGEDGTGWLQLIEGLRILLLALAVQLLSLGKAHAQYAYVTHPNVLVDQGATVAVLPANPLRAFVYCIIASPRKGDALAPSAVTMGSPAAGVPVYFPDRPPKPWANSGEVWVFSDQVALISCTELVNRRKASRTSAAPSPNKQNPM
jgi:hypothetical protein